MRRWRGEAEEAGQAAFGSGGAAKMVLNADQTRVGEIESALVDGLG